MTSPKVGPKASPRRRWVDEHAGPREKDLLARDEAVSFAQANSTPALFSVARAHGIWIEDVSGRSYRDFYGNNCHHVGYQHPVVIAKVREQLERYCFISRGLTSECSVRLGELLLSKYSGPNSKVLLAPGGSEAVEIALMIAKVHTGRHKTVSFWDSYHGRSAGALSVGGSPRDRSPRMGPLMPGALHIPPFYWLLREGVNDAKAPDTSAAYSLESLRALFKSEQDIAALIAEPVRNGPYVPPLGYWPEVRRLCDEHGVLLIFDDIPTGLGKTGRLFNLEHFSVKPDMTLIGKALGGTVAPLAAVVADTKLDTTGELNLSYYTHEKNALSAAAGLATLSVIIDERLPEKAASDGEVVRQKLDQLKSRYSVVVNARSIGLMFALDLRSPDDAEGLHFSLLKRGLLPMPPKGRTLSFSAPLVIERAELASSLDLIEEALKEMH